MSVIVYSRGSSGANAANDESEVSQMLEERMRGHGGTAGLSVSYRADQDRHGDWQNFGLVRIIADDEKVAQRYRNAKLS